MTEDDIKEPPPRDPNQAAAHYFLSELRTRISTQPLPYQHGDEDRALASLWEVFGQARESMKKYPGCDAFADAVTEMLNMELRPVTAKWHRASIEGRLKSRDGADEFRGDLKKAQQKLREFARILHVMAYGKDAPDALSPDVIGSKALDRYFEPVPFGIAKSDFIPESIVTAMNAVDANMVRERRSHYDVLTAEGTDAIGLALSGGGIRSATFCLGVVQVLAQRELFKDIDFLSTVSGGGYVGCFITARLGAQISTSLLEVQRELQTDANRLEQAKAKEDPAAAEPAEAEKELIEKAAELKQKQKEEAAARQKSIANPDGPDPGAVRYLRQHAKYLAALNLKQAWLMATNTLAGMLLNWTVPLSAIFIVAALAAAARQLEAPAIPWPAVLAIAAAVSLVALLAYGWKLPAGKAVSAPAGRWLARSLAVTALVAALWLVHDSFSFVMEHWTSSSILATLVTTGPAIIRFLPVAKNPKTRKIALQILLWLAAVIVPLGAIVLIYILADAAQHHRWLTVVLFVAGLGCACFAWRRLNINLTGPHRLYHDQLARTFVQTDENNDAAVGLSEINQSGYAPCHLINTTLNVPNSGKAALRERKSDFFLFAREYCGAPAIGYLKTADWKTDSGGLDLATAMAISGAAASSWMGLGTMPTLTALLTFLNVRLGYWIKNPNRPSSDKYPGFLCLMREMFGFSMSEQEAWLNLSDGGHIENLGIYELLRRRCKLIISVDGEADPAYTFQGLMRLVRHAQIDFGACIEVNLGDIRPDPKTGYSQAHAALCTVHYDDGALGFIIYMKLSVTGNESEMIRRYRINHPDFPHQTTLDQFFDEEQFEVYRQLGAHVASGLFSPALMDGNGRIDSVPAWFRHLVKNLLPGPIPGVAVENGRAENPPA